ncbi:zinc transporter-like protein [Leishmania infantum JPCM5]|uniref:Metal-ion_transporter_-_putative n=2 Tax=Leishmania infantum TaxID=5671 RepID=A0A6L0XKZ8_LEIIN|nr:zinc transporter-like protein [Leishmania infantum JPCM5]CAC9520782.1 metal-ion_transporter_-_putative [Leishmania infantum]CAM70624.1 zinc transporter-like protein [Leishmania infantum JPCM5]SUZ44474.1 metal-ion_transporter_-_putative [Leishmania infantum]|eukprot:XP_001467564.1 zinc transporter-like protein [Leishmania infantum JPCM5]
MSPEQPRETTGLTVAPAGPAATNYHTASNTVHVTVAEERTIDEALSAVNARRESEKKVLLGALIFCFVFMIVEFASGVIAHSLALLTDAIHLLTDVGSYALSIGALVAAGRAACGRYSYGWHRAEVIGTLISVFSIWALVTWIVIEAGYRTYDMYMCSRVPAQASAGAVKARECQAVDSRLMILVGVLGMLVNVVCASILYFGGSHGHSHFGSSHGHSHGESEMHDHDHSHRDLHEGGHGHNHAHDDRHDHGHDHGHGHGYLAESGGGIGSHKGFAVHAAILHAMGDCVQSIGVIFAGSFIYFSNLAYYGNHTYEHSLFNLADPFCSVMFALITLSMTKALLMDLLSILMESTPASVDYYALETALQQIGGVASVHDLHVWSLSAEYVSLSVHLVADNAAEALQKAQHICKEHFGIGHTTIQIDSVAVGTAGCASACASPTAHDEILSHYM